MLKLMHHTFGIMVNPTIALAARIITIMCIVLTFWYSPIGLVKALGIVAGIEKPITNNTTTIDTTIAMNIPRCQSVIIII